MVERAPSPTTGSLPQFQSHKIVRAAPVIEVIYRRADDGGENGYDVTVQTVNGPQTYFVGSTVFARGLPVQGDYLVVYDDDYVSWSPRKTFEDGYSAAKAPAA